MIKVFNSKDKQKEIYETFLDSYTIMCLYGSDVINCIEDDNIQQSIEKAREIADSVCSYKAQGDDMVIFDDICDDILWLLADELNGNCDYVGEFCVKGTDYDTSISGVAWSILQKYPNVRVAG